MPYSLDKRSATLDFWIRRDDEWYEDVDNNIIPHYYYLINMMDECWVMRPNYLYVNPTHLHILNLTQKELKKRRCKGCFMCNPKLSEEMLKAEEDMYECPKCGGEENIPLCKTHNICSSCWFNAIDILIKYRQNKKLIKNKIDL